MGKAQLIYAQSCLILLVLKGNELAKNPINDNSSSTAYSVLHAVPLSSTPGKKKANVWRVSQVCPEQPLRAGDSPWDELSVGAVGRTDPVAGLQPAEVQPNGNKVFWRGVLQPADYQSYNGFSYNSCCQAWSK